MSLVSGITFILTNDNIVFPFSTDFLLLNPICLILNNATGLTTYNDIKVITISISAETLQNYIVLITGFTLVPLGYYNNYAVCTTSEIQNTENVSNICYKGDDLDILDNDEEFSDFDNFVMEYNTTSD